MYIYITYIYICIYVYTYDEYKHLALAPAAGAAASSQEALRSVFKMSALLYSLRPSTIQLSKTMIVMVIVKSTISIIQ